MRAASTDRTGFAGYVTDLARRRPFFLLSFAGLTALIISSWWMVLSSDDYGPGIFTSEAWSRAGQFLSDLAGSGSSSTPAFREWSSWREALKLANETLVMSVLAAGIAGSRALLTVAFGASNITHGSMAPAGPVVGRLVFAFTRSAYLLTRAVPELIWALLVVFVISPGVLAGAVALGIHNFGVLGRLGAEVVEDVDPGPVNSLRSSGASDMQAFVYGVLPQALPQFVTFLLYRWEVIIRTSVVVGLVAATGLGYQFRLDLAFFRYTDVALILMVYVGLVWTVDLVSIWLRRLAR